MRLSSPTPMLRATAALALVMFGAVASYAADSADGSMTVNGKTVALRYAYAGIEPDFFDKKETNIVVLLSDMPVTAEQFADHFGPEHLKLTGVKVSINKDKQIVSGTIYSPELTKYNGSFSATGMHTLEPTTLTTKAVAGKLYMAKQDDFFGTKYQYSATFSATVGAAPKGAEASHSADAPAKGKPLPPGGGEPGKAYLAYTKVLVAGDLSAVRKAVTAERAKQMDDPDFAKMFPLIQAMEAKNINVTSGTIDGTSATLAVTGKSDGSDATGTVSMKQEKGVWKVEQESWGM